MAKAKPSTSYHVYRYDDEPGKVQPRSYRYEHLVGFFDTQAEAMDVAKKIEMSPMYKTVVRKRVTTLVHGVERIG